jgi:hypothetical protein
MPVARKPHQCFWCRGWIEEGEKYVRMTVVVFSQRMQKKSLASICLHEECFFDDDFSEEDICGFYLRDNPWEDWKITDIVKAY